MANVVWGDARRRTPGGYRRTSVSVASLLACANVGRATDARRASPTHRRARRRRVGHGARTTARTQRPARHVVGARARARGGAAGRAREPPPAARRPPARRRRRHRRPGRRRGRRRRRAAGGARARHDRVAGAPSAAGAAGVVRQGVRGPVADDALCAGPAALPRRAGGRALGTQPGRRDRRRQAGCRVAAVAASPVEAEALARRVQGWFAQATFRVYTSSDLVGVETSGAVKNVIWRPACPTPSRSATTPRPRWSPAAWRSWCASARTSGVSRAPSTASRGRLARGATLAELEAQGLTAEGLHTVAHVDAYARRHGLDLPLTREVHAVVHGTKAPAEALRTLLARQPTAE